MTEPGDYRLNKQDYMRDEYRPEVQCYSCDEWLFQDEALEIDGRYYHEDCIT